MYYTYVLLSEKDNKFYTGFTNDLKKRLVDHNNGKVFSTKHRAPLKLVYYEACCNEDDAKRREKSLKSGRGKAYLKKHLKIFLIQCSGFGPLTGSP
ncbi:GIY-YIG nuclease family protein [candidate division WWE3 bacterium]|uniref:GIY-YIG nuclease family protein n=1 Tax=candidate division WWE3 bacterium TaxID=2053526 RepID=A0A955RPF8_UNCKA|nr:GIY-YIG nuclease family protein [candidate division WWE3 bacterium]